MSIEDRYPCDELCCECGTSLITKSKYYKLNNNDKVCSKKCLNEYAVTYFSDYNLIKVR